VESSYNTSNRFTGHIMSFHRVLRCANCGEMKTVEV
jgi:hypothetical protein